MAYQKQHEIAPLPSITCPGNETLDFLTICFMKWIVHIYGMKINIKSSQVVQLLSKPCSIPLIIKILPLISGMETMEAHSFTQESSSVMERSIQV